MNSRVPDGLYVVQFKMVCHEMSSRSGNPEVLKFAKVSELLFKLARQRTG